MSKRRKAVLSAVAAVVLVAVAFTSGLVRIYDNPDAAGIVAGTDTHLIGFEWRGGAGFYVNGE